ncbi:hypothetical protein EDB86DRAFT_3099491 [Lactarius hatsudake]|nr:hypothetical protein EDB86DRAFT_3099491 [Lactarius hatsudake]
MASSRLALSQQRFPLRISGISVRHAAKREAAGDPTMENIRKALYPPNVANKPTPTGTWRPDVARAIQLAIPSKQAHDTIERAWLLHQRHQRWKREEELARKYECMRKAMDELEKIDPHLFKEANRVDDPRQRGVAEYRVGEDSPRGREKSFGVATTWAVSKGVACTDRHASKGWLELRMEAARSQSLISFPPYHILGPYTLSIF